STISTLQPRDLALYADSVGQVTPLMDAEIVDEHDRPLPPGAVGMLRVRGPKVGTPMTFAGDEASEEFRNGWHYTGDVASVNDHMYLTILGRTAEVIIRRGAKIFPAEIEAVLQNHPAVVETAVVGHPGANGDESAAAFVVAHTPVVVGDLLAHCRSRLTPYK